MPTLLPHLDLAAIAGIVLFALTASLLFFANMEGAGELGRPAAALSLISLAGGIACMFLAYTGKDDEFPAFDGETVAAPARPKPSAIVMPLKPKAPADQAAAFAKTSKDPEAAAAPAVEADLVAAEDARAPGEAFKECPECPVMVVLPTGYFQLGAAANDEDASAAEKPQRGAVIRRPLAMARTEITNGQYAAFLAAGGRTAVACGAGTEQADAERPASCVSYRDAFEYAAWLSRLTGQRYRLATAAEWEFAARAGSTERFASGAAAPTAALGLAQGPVPAAGSFGLNAFGLADLGGSLAEITADCVVGSLEHAPTDGTAAGEAGDCSRRIVKDGGWREPAARARVSARRAIAVEARSDWVGIRVVRDMERRTAARR